MSYTPNPLNVADVQIPKTLQPLLESLAKNTHDVWAQGRMADGWVYGETYSKAKKHHPCLIPYDQLPESEKEVDRRTTQNVMKALLLFGADISFPNANEE